MPLHWQQERSPLADRSLVMSKQLQDPLTNFKLELLYMLRDISCPPGPQSGNMDFKS